MFQVSMVQCSSWQCFVSKGSTWSCGQQWSVSCVCVCEECRCIITVSMQCSLYWWTLAGEGHWSLLVWSVWRGLLPICYLFYFSQVILLGCWDSACVHSYSKSCSAHLRYRELHWPVWFSAVCRRGMAGHFRLHRVIHSRCNRGESKNRKGRVKRVQRSRGCSVWLTVNMMVNIVSFQYSKSAYRAAQLYTSTLNWSLFLFQYSDGFATVTQKNHLHL